MAVVVDVGEVFSRLIWIAENKEEGVGVAEEEVSICCCCFCNKARILALAR